MEIDSVKLMPDGGWIVNGALAVPDDPGNREARLVADWIAAGNAPDAADEPAAPEPDDLAVTVAALEAKIGLTEQEKTAARETLRGR